MNRRGILTAFFACFMIVFASLSAMAALEDDTILRLSGITNAHAEIYSGVSSDYLNIIKFSDVFPTSPVPVTPHPACTSTNTILKLSGDTNAHAQAAGQTPVYSTSVCYSNLGCIAKNTDCNLLDGERCVVRLSDYNNAHLGTCDDSDYAIRLCCKPGGVTIPPTGCNINGVLESQNGEQCDTTVPAGKTCSDISTEFTGGTLTCGTDCRFNTAGCTGVPAGTCGDGQVNTGEQCDDNNVLNGDGCSSTCQYECPSSPTAADVCTGEELIINYPLTGSECRRVTGTKTGIDCSSCPAGESPANICQGTFDVVYANNIGTAKVICNVIPGTKICTVPCGDGPAPDTICEGLVSLITNSEGICGYVTGTKDCTAVCDTTNAPTASEICQGDFYEIEDSEGSICKIIRGTGICTKTCPAGPAANTICDGERIYRIDEDGKICGEVMGSLDCTVTCPSDQVDALTICEGKFSPVYDSNNKICDVVQGTASCPEACNSDKTASQICSGQYYIVKNANDKICDAILGTKTCTQVCDLTTVDATNICIGQVGFAEYADGTVCGTVPGTKDCAVGEIADAYWATVDGSYARISAANIGSDVALVAKTGLDVKFDLYRKDTTLGIDGLDPDDKIASDLQSTQAGDKRVYVYKIKQSDFEGTSDSAEFYFIAKSGIKEKTSDNLLVDKTIIVPDEFPAAVITSPIADRPIIKGIPVTFSHSSTDAETAAANLIVEWTLNTGSGTAVTKTDNSFSYIFTTLGLKTVTLKVTDSKGQEASQSISFNIVDILSGSQMYVSIDKPLDNQVVITEDPNAAVVIEYNASQESYALELGIAGCDVTAVCLAGSCPTTYTFPEFGACPAQDVTVEPGLKKGDFDELFFKWTFESGTPISQGFEASSGTRAYSPVWGKKTINVLMNYSNDAKDILLEEVASREFWLFDESTCSMDGSILYKVENGKVKYALDTTGESTYCVGNDNAAGTDDDCCPSGMYCSEDSKVGLGCVIDSREIYECIDYTAESECKNDVIGVLAGTPGNMRSEQANNANCGRTIGGSTKYCKCSWDASAETKCKLKVTELSTSNPEVNSPLSSCVQDMKYIDEKCTEGIRMVEITETCGGVPDATPELVALPCGRTVLQLPVFGWIQFTTAMLAIMIIYFFAFVRRNN